MKRKNTFKIFIIENGSKQHLTCLFPKNKSNDDKAKDKICKEKIIAMRGRKMIVKPVQIKRKQNETRKKV